MKKSKIVICVLAAICIISLSFNVKQYTDQENMRKEEQQYLADTKENTLKLVPTSDYLS